MFLRVYFHG